MFDTLNKTFETFGPLDFQDLFWKKTGLNFQLPYLTPRPVVCRKSGDERNTLYLEVDRTEYPGNLIIDPDEDHMKWEPGQRISECFSDHLPENYLEAFQNVVEKRYPIC